jgi:hypothetical protein
LLTCYGWRQIHDTLGPLLVRRERRAAPAAWTTDVIHATNAVLICGNQIASVCELQLRTWGGASGAYRAPVHAMQRDLERARASSFRAMRFE